MATFLCFHCLLHAKVFEGAISSSKLSAVSSPDNQGALKIVAHGASPSAATSPIEAILSSSSIDRDFVVSDSEACHFSQTYLTSKFTRIRDFPRFTTPFSALSADMTDKKRTQWNINN